MPLSATGRSWILFDNGLLVFERPAESSSGPRLLVSRVELCTAQACDCRDVTLRSIGLDAGVALSSELAVDGLQTLFKAGQGMESLIDLDLGTVAPDDYEGRTSLSGEWLAFLQSQVDGELLDLLHARWLRAKAMKSTEKTDWAARDAGALVGWHEAHPGDRSDHYVIDDVTYLADDLYCVNPGCTCNEVTVSFAEMVGPDDAKAIGSTRIHLPDGEALEREADPGKWSAIDTLWNAVRARHRGVQRFETRRQRMAELGRLRQESSRHQPQRSAKRVGRNERCPCGSGNKYKHCCASRSQ